MRNPEDFIGETLLNLPWWVNILLAGITFMVLYYAIPAIEFENPVVDYTVDLFSRVLAYVHPVILILFAILSALKKRFDP